MIFNRNGLSKQQELQNEIVTLKERLAIASHFLDKISKGSFDIRIEQDLHQSDDEGRNFMGLLNRTKDKLFQYSISEQQRLWTSDGVSKFMDLMRGDNSKRTDFFDKILSLLVQFTKANQGGIFILNDENADDRFLQLTSCYAYSKKRFLEKRIDIGDGLLGQCFLERATCVYTDVPKSYVTITSGLGEATPNFLLLVPLKYDEHVMGVIELASFEAMQPYQIEFIERIAENIASVALGIKSKNQVDQLFEESKLKARMLQEQEEQLRQNVEELISTQEGMKRNQMELDQQTNLLKLILNSLPFPVFVKDDLGKYVMVNTAEAKLFNLSEKELIGKDDSHFVMNEDEWKVIQESDEKVMSSNSPVELPLQSFTTTQGLSYVFKTTKIPFINNITGRKNILGVSIDLTEKLDLEKKLFHEKRLSQNNVLINVVGRQRMLSQKIGFYSEMLVRGKKKSTHLLCEAIELFEHTLQIIRYGGMPMGVQSESPLHKSDETLLPYLERIDLVWKPYKQAAENILYFYTLENKVIVHDGVKDIPTIEDSITHIEEHGEMLLKLNNELILACIALNQTDMAEVS